MYHDTDIDQTLLYSTSVPLHLLNPDNPNSTTLRRPRPHKIELRRINTCEISILQTTARKFEGRKTEMEQAQSVFGLGLSQHRCDSLTDTWYVRRRTGPGPARSATIPGRYPSMHGGQTRSCVRRPSAHHPPQVSTLPSSPRAG